MTDVQTASVEELVDEIRNRCEAQKETFAIVYGSPEKDILNYTYTGSLGTIIGTLTHMIDFFRRRMMQLGDEAEKTEDNS